MKRSLPMEFFHSSSLSTTPIYDNQRSPYIEVLKKDHPLTK